jgi:shikimate kinase
MVTEMTNQPSNIYLVGFMGSGKTTFGKIMAKALNMTFIDMDTEIESTFGKSIAQLFDELGEPGFRQMERDTLHRLSAGKHCLISTGGGAPCHYDNMDFMNAHGETIYLQASVKELVNRLKGVREARPLLRDKSEEELESHVRMMLERREPDYMKATCLLNTDGLDAVALLSRYLSQKKE